MVEDELWFWYTMGVVAALYVVLVTFVSARLLYRCQRARGQRALPAWTITIIAAVLILACWTVFPGPAYLVSAPALLAMRAVELGMRPPRPAPLPRAIVTSCPAPR